MARITWQNVDAPDFSGSADLLRGFATSLDTGLQRAAGTIKEFDDQKTDAVSNLLAQRAARYTDPDQLEADLASGKILEGLPMNRVSKTDLAALDSRTNGLLARDVTQEALGWDKFSHGYDRETLARKEAAAPILAQALALSNAGDDAGANKILAENQALISELRFDDIAKTYSGVQDSSKGALDYRQGVLDYGQDKTLFDRDTTTYEEGRAVQKYIAEGQQFAGDPDEALGWVNKSDIPMHLRPAVLAGLTGALGLVGVGGSGGDGGSVSGGSGVTSGKFEDVIGGLLNREGGYVGNDAGRGATNLGINSQANPGVDVANLTPAQAQGIYKTKYWNPVVKAGVPAIAREAVFDFGVNAGIDKSLELWNKSGGDLETFNQLRINHYQSLVRKDPKKYGKYLQSWMDRVAATSPPDRAVAAGIGQAAGDTFHPAQQQRDNDRRPASQTLQDYAETHDNRANALAVARQLTRKGGTFEGGDESFFLAHINRMTKLYGINPAMAGRILSRNIKRKGVLFGDEGYWESVKNNLSPGARSAAYVVDWDGVDKAVRPFLKDRSGPMRGTEPVAREAGQQAGAANVAAQIAAYRTQETNLSAQISLRKKRGQSTAALEADLASISALRRAAERGRQSTTAGRGRQ